MTAPLLEHGCAEFMPSDFKPEVVIWLTLRMRSEKSPTYTKSSIERQKFPRYEGNP